MKIWRKLRQALLVTALIAGGLALPTPANAFGPSVLFAPSGDCNRPYCTTYAKSVQTNTGRILASFEDDNQPARGQTLPIFSSTDDGRSWRKIAAVADTSPRRWGSNWTNPYLYVLPQAIGGSPFVITLPNGRLAYNSHGSTDIRINTANGTGAWTPVRTTMPLGYSRMPQHVRGTGRVLVLAAEGFWVSVHYGDVDLGNSAGRYYRLVNRRSGKVLAVWQASGSDGARVVQWSDTGALDQQWQLVRVQ